MKTFLIVTISFLSFSIINAQSIEETLAFANHKMNLNTNSTSEILNVNGHLHTPFSFSAFTSIDEIFEKAANENVKVVGINDFNTTKGYNEFYTKAKLDKC